MVKIEAIIKPRMLEAVQEALHYIGVQGMTVSEVRGFGRQKGQPELYRGAEYRVDYIPKVKVEVVVDKTLSKEVHDAIVGAARSGKIGDGKIFVSPVASVTRIRTGEQGRSAI
jgi:nitrogen regulatory protein PII